ncbi:hypothetical protein BCR39DRAFT_534407 [Naematelia encephala]|uniref:COX assembly mitochondrial protein n=1 Tax=Naematelia encephala TaxID=71784 RepID=A0A1Y2B299_9TREE|nr:hypothetical protein BCR39DRAFT_534407 [Naematelia encephala]
MQALSRREETDLMDRMRKEALVKCEDVVREYVECTKSRTVTIGWACKDQLKAWTECMHRHVTQETIDAAKLDYLATRGDKEKEAIERLKKERVESYKRHAGIKE